MQRFFGSVTPLRFSEASPEPPVRGMVWGARPATIGTARVEDGFLRSKGLGAKLVPPLSLVLDRSGIYFDPTEPSDLEALIAKRAQLRPDQEMRAKAVIRSLIRGGVSKYNLGGALPDLPEGRRILVPGQVEDDASILLGAGDIRTNRALIEAARSANPEAVILYKPHPDVVAGLRKGAVGNAHELADMVLPDADIAALLDGVDEVWTMTSLTGFEALLRRKKVTVLGAPFYAGWGLTKDLGPRPERRKARPSLEGLVHAALIDYPRYLDPVTGQPCPEEVRSSGSWQASRTKGRTCGFWRKCKAFSRVTPICGARSAPFPSGHDIGPDLGDLRELPTWRIGKGSEFQATHARQAFRTDDGTGTEDDEVIDEACLHERRRKLAAAFAENTGEAGLCQGFQSRTGCDLAVFIRHFDQGRTSGAPCVLPCLRRICTVEKPERHVLRRGRHPALGGQIE